MGLRNKEFPQLYTQLCSVIEAEAVEDVNVKESLEDALSYQEELKFVMNMRDSHPLTEVLENQAIMRKDYLVSLRGKVYASLRAPSVEERNAAKVLARWINKHCENIYVPSINVYSRMVNNMNQDFDLNATIQQAISEVGVTGVWDSIIAITQEIDENFKTRTEEKAANIRRANAMKREAYRMLKKYLGAVEVALSLEKPGEHFYLDCSRVIDEYLEHYRVKLAARKTRSKNAAEKAEMEKQEEAQPEDGAQDDGTTEPTDGKPAMAGGSGKFGVMTSNGMDLHNGTTGESVEGKRAMSENGQNGVALDGSDERGMDQAAGNGGLVNEDLQDDTTADVTKTGHEEGAVGSNDLDHES